MMAFPTSKAYPGTPYRYAVGDAQVSALPNAPTDVWGGVVTEERVVMVIGSADDPTKLRWSDRDNPEEWTPTKLNYANVRSLPTAGALRAIRLLNSQVLILSDTDAFLGSSVGAPYVYNFERVGTNCGIFSASTLACAGDVAVWLGDETFWIGRDGRVSKLYCPIMDYLRKDIDTSKIATMSTAVNTRYNELWWLYRDASSPETNKYVAYNWVTDLWHFGALDRTVMVCHDATGSVRMLDHTGVSWRHELFGVNCPDSYAETGPIDIAHGNRNAAIREFYPDGVTGDGTEIGFYSAQQACYEGETFHGMAPATSVMNPRVMGRQIRLRVEFKAATGRFGMKPRIEFAPMTGRR
jgi:hypothetical protein